MDRKRPNILIFNPDHYRGEAMGHLGNPCVRTPNLDGLVQGDAVSFRHAFAQNGVCVPSRCSFMSGWYPHTRGHRTMFHMMREDEPVLLRTLKQQGYFVWWGGKNDLVPAQRGLFDYCDIKYEPRDVRHGNLHAEIPEFRGKPKDAGFFSFFKGKNEKHADEEDYTDYDMAVVKGAVEQIGAMPKGKPFGAAQGRPFCIYLPLASPHPPFAVDEPFYSIIDRGKVPPRIPTPKWNKKPSILKGIYEKSGFKRMKEEQWNEMRAVYYGMCSRVDHMFGMVLKALKQAGAYDDTAVFFFSDHGMWAGDYGLVDINQNTCEDSLLRVPFVFKPPRGTKLKPGVRNELVELVDFPATVEELAGISPSHTHFGRSLLPLARGEGKGRDAVFAEGGRLQGEEHCKELEYEPGHTDPHDIYYPRLVWQAGDGPEHGKAVMCRTRTHKYVRRLYEQDELYDLKRDPGELENRIDDPKYAGVLAKLKDRLLEFQLTTVDAVPHKTDKR